MRIDEHKRRDQKRAEVFEHLRDRTFDLLEEFGEPDFQPHKSQGDFSVHGDYSGYPELVVFVSNLTMLKPKVVLALRDLIKEFPGWQIAVTVAVRGHFDDWPHMGSTSVRTKSSMDCSDSVFRKSFRVSSTRVLGRARRTTEMLLAVGAPRPNKRKA
jgi:hypothetical protein